MKMKPKGGMAGGRQPKATEMGAESNKQYVKRMFGMGMSTRMTNDIPMENKGYQAGKKVEMGKRPMTTKGGMSGGRNSKRMMKTKGGMRGGFKRGMKTKGGMSGGYKRGMKTKSYARGGKS
tara:strand:- start:337 stop:699 length:363 start_codon:yes stop_codon:yes gene_type:complete